MQLNSKTLTSTVFHAGMTELSDAFNKELTEGLLKVYYRRINFCTDKAFLQAVDDILDKEKWFPTISVFLNWLPAPKVYQPSIDSLCG